METHSTTTSSRRWRDRDESIAFLRNYTFSAKNVRWREEEVVYYLDQTLHHILTVMSISENIPTCLHLHHLFHSFFDLI